MGTLNKLKYYLPESAMLKLNYSLVLSHVNYNLTAWGNGNTYPTYLSKIQNKAIKIITGSDRAEVLNPLYQKCEIFDVTKMSILETAKIVYKCL